MIIVSLARNLSYLRIEGNWSNIGVIGGLSRFFTFKGFEKVMDFWSRDRILLLLRSSLLFSIFSVNFESF